MIKFALHLLAIILLGIDCDAATMQSSQSQIEMVKKLRQAGLPAYSIPLGGSAETIVVYDQKMRACLFDVREFETAEAASGNVMASELGKLFLESSLVTSAPAGKFEVVKFGSCLGIVYSQTGGDVSATAQRVSQSLSGDVVVQVAVQTDGRLLTVLDEALRCVTRHRVLADNKELQGDRAKWIVELQSLAADWPVVRDKLKVELSKNSLKYEDTDLSDVFQGLEKLMEVEAKMGKKR